MGLRTQPPGPKEKYPGEFLFAFHRDPTGFLLRLAEKYGDIVYFPLGSLKVYLFNHPDLIKDVLVNHHRRFKQGLARRQAKRLLGEGLITTEGEAHLRKRRVLQPIFHRQRVQIYGTTIAEFASETSAGWREGQTMDVAHAMWRLALRITAKTLFDTSVESEAEEISQAVDELTAMFNPLMLFFADWLMRVPSPIKRRYETARKNLHEKIDRLIREHRAGGDRGDLLSMLLAAHQNSDDGEEHSEDEIRDEALESFLAGHGTIALALAWTYYLLSQHPAIEARLHREVNTVLAGRPPTVSDLDSLVYTRMVLAEAMRLYPPTWVFDRETCDEYHVRSYCLPRGSTVLVSQWVTHHDPRWFPDAFRFDPERFTEDRKAQRPDYAYFPFGGGPRLCIGEPLAWMEGVMIMATIAQSWRMRLQSQPRVELLPRFSLEAKAGIPMRLERRVPQSEAKRLIYAE